MEGYVLYVLWGALFFSVVANILLFRKKVLPRLKRPTTDPPNLRKKKRKEPMLIADAAPPPPEQGDPQGRA